MLTKFQIIVADPPYSFSDKLSMSNVKRGAASNYITLSIDELKLLPIKNIADPNGCILALWVPSSLLQDGLDIMKAWGFTQKQTYIWIKTKQDPFNDLFNMMKNLPILQEKIVSKKLIKETFNTLKKECHLQFNNFLQFGLGRLYRQTHELVLIGINNTNIYKTLQNRSQRSVCFATNLKHSAKPEALQDSLEIMFPNTENKRLELFARRERMGWLCLGNEVGSKEDIRLSLSNILKSIDNTI